MEANTFTLNILKEISLPRLLLTTSLIIWVFTSKKFSALFWSAATSTLYKRPLISSILTNGVMEHQFSQNQVQLPGNSKTKLKLVRLELTFPFQFLCLCSPSQETRNHFTEIWTFTVKTELSSSPNGRQLLRDGNKKTSSPNFLHHSQPINEDHYLIIEWILL